MHQMSNHLIMAIGNFVKSQAMGMMRYGRKVKLVAEALEVSLTIVSSWWKRWQCEGSLLKKKGSGRHRKTGRTDSKLILSIIIWAILPISILSERWKIQQHHSNHRCSDFQQPRHDILVPTQGHPTRASIVRQTLEGAGGTSCPPSAFI